MFLGEGIEREALMKAFSWLKKNNTYLEIHFWNCLIWIEQYSL